MAKMNKAVMSDKVKCFQKSRCFWQRARSRLIRLLLIEWSLLFPCEFRICLVLNQREFITFIVQMKCGSGLNAPARFQRFNLYPAGAYLLIELFS